MGFDKKLKVTAICAVTLVSNLVLAAEGRVANKTAKARTHQTKRMPMKHLDVTENVVEKPQVLEPSVASEPIIKKENTPVEMMAPPLELKGIRG